MYYDVHILLDGSPSAAVFYALADIMLASGYIVNSIYMIYMNTWVGSQFYVVLIENIGFMSSNEF